MSQHVDRARSWRSTAALAGRAATRYRAHRTEHLLGKLLPAPPKHLQGLQVRRGWPLDAAAVAVEVGAVVGAVERLLVVVPLHLPRHINERRYMTSDASAKEY